MSHKRRNKSFNSNNNRSLAAKESETSTKQVAVSREYRHSGPIPDPYTLQLYEDTVPGAAERIIAMAERQSAHRQELEKKVINSGSRDSLLGIISATIIALATLASGTYVISIGKTWSGTIIGSAGLIGLVGVFIYGTRSSRKEREQQK